MNNRLKKQQYQREWIRKRREAFFSDKQCVTCGGVDDLELDHIDPKTKRYNPASLWGMSDQNKNKIKELAKCQVLCSSCHSEKTSLERASVVVHGTSAMYNNRKCRCAECKSWNRDYRRAYRSRTK